VYGSLRSGFENRYARLLRAQSEFLGPASVRGSVFQLGEYPGYRPEGDDVVQGELYRLFDPEATFRILDEYEGPEYERVLIDVGWIYQLRERRF
jgi:gamma-glutamylcyclotransferase (GGCT)/AIG2-like uncharacterized protein YtfP